MNKYTIYCTEAQTKKAIEIGAPIERCHDGSRYFNIGVPTFFDENDEICKVKNSVIFIPTAEQMIGWLEEQGMQFNFLSNIFNEWEVIVYTENTDNVISEITDSDWKKTKKEAIFVAIDASLEYLYNNKK